MRGINFYYDCPECKEQTSAWVPQSEYAGSDQLGQDMEEQKQRLCQKCQMTYDTGGLKTRDFI